MNWTKLSLVLVALVSCVSSHRYPEVALLPKSDLELAGRPLSASEAKVVGDSGFAILEHGETRSFHVGYTAVFHAHQPVYVTADSILYAWHSSYDGILMTIERGVLIGALSSLVDDLIGGLASVRDAQDRADLELYLDVAKSLVRGRVTGGDDVKAMVKLAEAASGSGELTLFGASDAFDFSICSNHVATTRSCPSSSSTFGRCRGSGASSCALRRSRLDAIGW